MLLSEPFQQQSAGAPASLWPNLAPLSAAGWRERIHHSCGTISSVVAERSFGPNLHARIEIAWTALGWSCPAWILSERRDGRLIEIAGDVAASVEACALAAQKAASFQHYVVGLAAELAEGRA